MLGIYKILSSKIFVISTVLLLVSSAGFYYKFIKSKFQVQGKIANLASPLIIFDFDGVICDSYDMAIELLNNISNEYSLKYIKDTDKKEYRDLTTSKFLSKIGVSKLKLPFVIRRLKKEIKDQIDNLEPFEGMLEVIKKLKLQSFSVGIVSSNSIEAISKFFLNNGSHDIDFVCSNSGLFAKHKVFDFIVKKSKLNSKDIYYVGDEARDVVAGKKANIKTIAVSWGFQSAKILHSFNPFKVIDSPEQLINVIPGDT